jgi:2-methylcitrate dehydratase PrpD
MVTERLVDHCLRADGDRDALPAHLLDWFSVTIGGAAHADSSPAVLDGIDALCGPAPDPGTDPAATLVPSGRRLTPADAAFANGTFAHSLDFDDTHLGSSLHPAAPTIAAALAAAEAANASVERFYAAIAAGYDVACTVGELVGPNAHYARGFHITATCGTFGAVAAAGVASGLAETELRDAFGIAGSQAAGSIQFLENGAWNKRLHPGLAARRGIEATTLAAAGVVGAEAPIDGEYGFLAGYTPDPDHTAIDRLETRDAVAETGLKPYPCCRYLHAAIDGLRELAPSVKTSAVSAVEIAIPSPGVRLTGDPIEAKRRPQSFVDCQFSAPFVAALTLETGTADAATFLRAVGQAGDPPRWETTPTRRLMDATSVTTDETIERRFPDEWGARVSVQADGETHSAIVRVPSGEPEAPLADDEVRKKTTGLLRDTGVDPDQLAETILERDPQSVATIVDAATSGGR